MSRKRAARGSDATRECAVCLEEFRCGDGTEATASFQCAHVFCARCDRRLLGVGDHRCPTCRAPRIGFSASAANQAAVERFAPEVNADAAIEAMRADGWVVQSGRETERVLRSAGRTRVPVSTVIFSASNDDANTIWRSIVESVERSAAPPRRARRREHRTAQEEEEAAEAEERDRLFALTESMRNSLTDVLNALTRDLPSTSPRQFRRIAEEAARR